MRPTVPLTPKLKDADAERVRVAHQQSLADIQKLPFAGADYLVGVSLPNATSVAVPHKLNRRPKMAWPGFVSGATAAGYINVESMDDRYITLRATGYGATITLTVGVL